MSLRQHLQEKPPIIIQENRLPTSHEVLGGSLRTTGGSPLHLTLCGRSQRLAKARTTCNQPYCRLSAGL